MTKITICILSLFCGISAISAQPYYEWGKNLGGMDSEIGRAVMADTKGNVYTAGYFNGTTDFDPGSSNFDLSPVGSIDAFISKVDASGNFLWAAQFAGLDDELINGMTLDAKGNVYVTGYFGGTVDFDPALGNAVFLTSVGNLDIFVCKLDTDGNLVWVQQMGGLIDDAGYSIALDSKGNVYTTGGFGDVADFNPGTGTYNLTAGGTTGAYISKLDPSGNFVWAKNFTGTSDNWGNSIAVDKNDNVVTTGYFDGTADFDPGLLPSNMTTRGDFDVFISKLDSAGKFVWAKQLGGPSIDKAWGIALDGNANIYTTGFFFTSCDFDPGAATYNLSVVGDMDVFVSKLDASGNFVWAKSMGGNIDDVAYSISVDAVGSVYTTGYFNDQADFDPGAKTYSFKTLGGRDIFISKLNTSGNFVWAKHLSGTGADNLGNCVSVDHSRNVYVTGYYTDSLDMNPDAPVVMIPALGNADIFVQKMSQCKTSTSSFNASVCNLYTSPSGKKWTVSNTYKDTIPNVGGCDSIMTIKVNIKKSSSSNINAKACNKYLSPSHKYEWTVSNTYKDTIANQAGCDSVITINLTINNVPSSSSISVKACNKYISPSGRHIWTTSDVYKDTIPNKAGCDSIITITLTINAMNIAVTQNGETLTAALAGATYQWVNCGNGKQPVSGQTNQSFTSSVNGSYAVIITMGACTDTSACYQITTAGIGEIEGNKLTASPNPANGMIRITSEDFLNNAELKLTDMQGRTVMQQNAVEGHELNIDISRQAAGIYFIEIIQNHQVARLKLVKY